MELGFKSDMEDLLNDLEAAANSLNQLEGINFKIFFFLELNFFKQQK